MKSLILTIEKYCQFFLLKTILQLQYSDLSHESINSTEKNRNGSLFYFTKTINKLSVGTYNPIIELYYAVDIFPFKDYLR